MKRIITLIALLFMGIPAGILGMQAPEANNIKAVTFDKPHTFKGKTLEINAYVDKKNVGHIHYEMDEEGTWYIQEILVDKEYRNSNKKVGFTLFRRCMKKILIKQPQKVYWWVSGIAEDSPDLETLTAIYEKMVLKLNLKNCKLTKDNYDTITYMELEFNKVS